MERRRFHIVPASREGEVVHRSSQALSRDPVTYDVSIRIMDFDSGKEQTATESITLAVDRGEIFDRRRLRVIMEARLFRHLRGFAPLEGKRIGFGRFLMVKRETAPWEEPSDLIEGDLRGSSIEVDLTGVEEPPPDG